MTLKEAKTLIAENTPYKVSIYKGIITVKSGYFYRHGRSEENVANKILSIIPNATIIDKFDDWNAWPKDSNFVVKFTV
jgi:hypothetical protein